MPHVSPMRYYVKFFLENEKNVLDVDLWSPYTSVLCVLLNLAL